MDVASLELQLIGTSDKAVAAIEKLTAALGALKSSVNIGSSASLKKLGANVTTLAESINKLDPKSVDALKVMGDALNGLTGAGKISSTLAKQVSELGKSIKELDDASIERIARLSAGLAPLAGINIQAFPKELDATTTSSKKSALSLAFLTTKFAALSYMYKKTASLLGPLITKSNEYVENLNLFTVTMGKAAGAAQDFAEKVSATVGIDTSEGIRTQGIFMALASGFGIASDSAAVMSQQLTQLAYDASSFFNLPFSESITKFQSAFAGEIEPVRRLGYDLNVTRLQQEAYALGIEKTVHNMTQAEKAALRYYALMKQNTIVQGDMARTLIAPANQLRVLQAQFSMLARELGNIFIPALNAILPTAIAVATALRMIAKEIASFFGYELPEIDYSGIQTLSSGAEDAEDALGGAAANAKKLKDYVMGIDELNIISPQEDSGGGAAGGGEDVLGKIPVETYDFLKDLKARSDEIAKGIKEEFEKMLPIIASIGAGLAVALAASKFIKWIGDVKSLSAAFNAVKDKVSALRTAIGIGFVVGGITLGALTGLDIAENGLNYSNILKSVGAVLAGGFGMKLLSTALGIGGLMGFGLGASIVLAIEGVTLSASAGYKIGYNGFDPDLFKRMIGGNIATILGLTVAGGLIAGVPGALVGLAGGILITLTADILAIDIGKHEKLKENINAQIFNNIGAITIPEITVPVENVMLDLLGSINADEIIANQGKMEMLTESIGSQRVRVDELMRAWQDGSITSQQAIDGLTDTVGTMVSQS
ncbi:MAG: hypothetical protein LBT32_01415, partial [Peptococcaceae bacterium]|nr:hypothetical protein [Peptococcaceae bacterium]